MSWTCSAWQRPAPSAGSPRRGRAAHHRGCRSADSESPGFAWIRIGATRPDCTAGVLKGRPIAVVVPDVPRVSPVPVRLGVAPASCVNSDIPVCSQAEGSEFVDVASRIAECPVSQRNRVAGPVMQVDPLSVQTGIRSSVGTRRVVIDLMDDDHAPGENWRRARGECRCGHRSYDPERDHAEC
jgi:hypothetical protein